MKKVAPAALVLAACAASAQAPVDADRERALFRLYYDFEVAAYCSAVDERVGRGFRSRSAELEAALALGGERIAALRGKAWQAAHGEWQNRGLGGFRAWCREDGARAARRIGAFAPRE